jgi:Ser/Thr protein kinase RdoA (MazF antagonist)
VPDYQRVAAEFGLGPVLGASPLTGGRPGVVRLATARGQFVLKPAYSAAEARLCEQAAVVLDAAGVRQAQFLRTSTGALISESGHSAQEFLPGRICPRPTPAQTAAVMRHAGWYHAALARVAVPAALEAEETIFTRVTRPGFLIQALPGLADRAGLPPDSREVTGRALARLETAVPAMRGLAPQLVHGDIGPDNVLMDGDQVVAVIDFTPHSLPVIFAIATAVYWYQVHGRPALDPAAIQASLAAAAYRPWTPAELVTWPAMLLREALRRLATSLAVAEQAGTPAPAAANVRYATVGAILDSWAALQPDSTGG